jgi:membrane protease subunit (stomatin/prohibitin family)
MFELRTANLRILSTLQAWPHGFQSPFKAEIYFFNMRRFTDLKWGTRNPAMLRDPEFGPVRLRAFGTYEVRIKDPALLLTELVGTDAHFTSDKITDQLRNLIVARFATILGSSGIPVLDLAANYDQLGQFVHGRIAPEFANYGLELTTLLVEIVSLPPAVEEAMDRRSSMGVIGDLSNTPSSRRRKRCGRRPATRRMAGAATGIGLGMGMAMAKHFADSMGGSGGGQGEASASPAPRRHHPYSPIPQLLHRPRRPAGRTLPIAELRQQQQAGRLVAESLVWAEGMAGWEKAGSVGDLASLFRAAPPPIPGGG